MHTIARTHMQYTYTRTCPQMHKIARARTHTHMHACIHTHARALWAHRSSPSFGLHSLAGPSPTAPRPSPVCLLTPYTPLQKTLYAISFRRAALKCLRASVPYRATRAETPRSTRAHQGAHPSGVLTVCPSPPCPRGPSRRCRPCHQPPPAHCPHQTRPAAAPPRRRPPPSQEHQRMPCPPRIRMPTAAPAKAYVPQLPPLAQRPHRRGPAAAR